MGGCVNREQAFSFRVVAQFSTLSNYTLEGREEISQGLTRVFWLVLCFLIQVKSHQRSSMESSVTVLKIVCSVVFKRMYFCE